MFIHFRQQMIVRRVIIKDSKSTQHGGFTATYRTSLHLLDCFNGIKKHTQNTNVERVGTGWNSGFHPSKKDMSLASIAYKLQSINFGGLLLLFSGSHSSDLFAAFPKKKKQGGPWNPTKKPSPGVRSSMRRRGQGKYQKHHLQNHVQQISYGQNFFKVVLCRWNSDTFLHNWTVM